MILLFPSLEIFRLAITSAALPAEVQASPVQALLTDAGEVCAEPSVPIADKTLAALQRLGVSVSPVPPDGELLELSCWLQAVPLEAIAKAAQTFDRGAVLFRIDSPDAFATLVAEMLRLGNDRQSFRLVQAGSRAATLLRVIDPPYYSLLSAIEPELMRSGGVQSGAVHFHNDNSVTEPQSPLVLAEADRSSPIAYIEQAPRVWVQLGFQHPLAARIAPPLGQMLLLEAPQNWRFVDEGAFQDVYQTLDLRLPTQPERWSASSLNSRIEIPLRLVDGNAGSVAELWVLRQRAMEQVEQLIVRSDDELVERLAFAAVESADGPIVVLRTRPSRQSPPILVLEALPCCTYLKLPNLFVPVGKRLNPPLRRDAVGKLLAADNRWLTWLEPAADGGFVPISIADSAFRPLVDWVEYIIDHERQALTAWTESHQFEFDGFACREDIREASRSPAERQPHASVHPKPAGATERKSTGHSERKEAPTADSAPALEPGQTGSGEAAKTKTNVLVERLKILEKDFLDSKETFDSPHRQDAWRMMGSINAHLKHRNDTTICWCNSLWNQVSPETQLLRDWLLCELRSSERTRIDIATVDEILANGEPGSKDVALLGAYLIHALAANKGVNDLKRRAAALAQFFPKQERYLPVRAVWLIARALHQLNDGDTLGLARTRDRVLERLFEHGLQAEFDVAAFLRGGLGSNDRQRVLRSELPSLHTAIDRWIVEPGASALAQNKTYARLICAYGLAKIGDLAACRAIVTQALENLGKDPIHSWMGRAFEYRINQVAKGMPDRGTLPKDLLAQLENMDRLTRYKVDRLRQQSRILEPHERIDPYRRWHRRYRDELYQSLAELQDLTDHDQLQKKLQHLLRQHDQGERGIRVLAAALELAPRLGEKFGSQLLLRADGLLSQCNDPVERALLLQRAIYVSAHFGRSDAVHSLFDRLNQALPSIVAEYLTMQSQYSPDHKERVDTVEALFLQSFRSLRKLGMRDEIALLYGRISDQIQPHQTASKKGTRTGPSEVSPLRRLRLLLCVASGWYYFGKESDAGEAAERVRNVLFEGSLSVADQRSLAVAYVHTVSQAPTEEALRRIRELFAVRASGGRALAKIEDAMTTSTHFSVAQLELTEASISSLLSDEWGASAVDQRWLDEDEFSVRKRIHADMKKALQ